MKHFGMLLTLAIALLACNQNTIKDAGNNQTITNNQNIAKMSNVYELAINKAKPGAYDKFLETRAAFVEILGKEENTLNEGKWKPFFTVGDMPLDDILVGMTHWNSMQGFGASAAKLLPGAEARNYFASFDPVVYAILEPVDGKPFDLESIKQAGNVVEFAIRKGKTEDAFGTARETFFKSLDAYEGYKFAREFKVYELDENSMPKKAEGVQAVIIVWENAEVFQAAATPIFGSPEYANFSSNLDVSAYFATSPTK